MTKDDNHTHNQSPSAKQAPPTKSDIPTINFDLASSPPPLQSSRPQSFELSRESKHAHFDSISSNGRPIINRVSLSHIEGRNLRRPSIHSRKSFATSISSFSLYSHFADEDFSSSHNEKRKQASRKSSLEKIDLEKKKTRKNDGGDEALSDTDSSIDDVASYKEDDDEYNGEKKDSPKASVGKAMFMFLKVFIGSGVLFLPKA